MKKNRNARIAGWTTLVLSGFLVCLARGEALQQQIVLQVRHDHAWGSCRGSLFFDDRGVRYETSAKEDARNWDYEDIKQFQVETSRRIRITTYEDRKWRLGADKVFEFEWEDEGITAQALYSFLQNRTHRPIAAALIPPEIGQVLYEFPVKHLGGITGHQGRLLFAEHFIVFDSEQREAGRTWRYEDLESVSSGGPYDLALTTYEQQRFHYASRRVYNFQLKQSMSRETYDALWRFVNRKKGLGLPGGNDRLQETR
jgi:hypothetical protein